MLVDVSLKLHILIFTKEISCGEELHMIFGADSALIKDLINYIYSTIRGVLGFNFMMGIEVSEEWPDTWLTLLFAFLIIFINDLAVII